MRYKVDCVRIAREIATEAHKLQKRFYDGKAYITHPEAVANRLKAKKYDNNHVIVAWLHDVLENTDMKVVDLKSKKIPHRAVKAVDTITRDKGDSYLKYILKVKRNRLAKAVKIFDIEHNLRDLRKIEGANNAIRNRIDKYEMALHILRGK